MKANVKNVYKKLKKEGIKVNSFTNIYREKIEFVTWMLPSEDFPVDLRIIPGTAPNTIRCQSIKRATKKTGNMTYETLLGILKTNQKGKGA